MTATPKQVLEHLHEFRREAYLFHTDMERDLHKLTILEYKWARANPVEEVGGTTIEDITGTTEAEDHSHDVIPSNNQGETVNTRSNQAPSVPTDVDAKPKLYDWLGVSGVDSQFVYTPEEKGQNSALFTDVSLLTGKGAANDSLREKIAQSLQKGEQDKIPLTKRATKLRAEVEAFMLWVDRTGKHGWDSTSNRIDKRYIPSPYNKKTWQPVLKAVQYDLAAYLAAYNATKNAHEGTASQAPTQEATQSTQPSSIDGVVTGSTHSDNYRVHFHAQVKEAIKVYEKRVEEIVPERIKAHVDEMDVVRRILEPYVSEGVQKDVGQELKGLLDALEIEQGHKELKDHQRDYLKSVYAGSEANAGNIAEIGMRLYKEGADQLARGIKVYNGNKFLGNELRELDAVLSTVEMQENQLSPEASEALYTQVREKVNGALRYLRTGEQLPARPIEPAPAPKRSEGMHKPSLV